MTFSWRLEDLIMKYPIYQVDAFTDRAFAGNPAGVMPLKSWLPDQVLQSIAAEMNLAETAFFVPQGRRLSPALVHADGRDQVVRSRHLGLGLRAQPLLRLQPHRDALRHLVGAVVFVDVDGALRA